MGTHFCVVLMTLAESSRDAMPRQVASSASIRARQQDIVTIPALMNSI